LQLRAQVSDFISCILIQRCKFFVSVLVALLVGKLAARIILGRAVSSINCNTGLMN